LFIAALSFRDFNSFCAALFVLDVAIFICISPIDAAVITFARVDQRATAMAFNIFVIHAFGDGVSRVLMGTVSDQFGLRSAVLLLPWVLSLAGFIWIAGVIRYFHAPQWPRLSIDLPKFQSHRGRTLRLNGSQQERDFIMNSENTMAAFRQARVHGALMCECDVRLTRDKQVIVYHDDSLLRFVPGDKRRVDEIDFAELRQLLAVPLLSELLSADDVPAKINIELKTGEIWGRSQLERLVVELIKEAKANDRVIVSSFNPLSLMRMARLAPHIPRALLVTQAREPGNAIYLRKMWLGFLARPHLLHVDDAMANARQLTRWRERGLLVAVWTVNSIERARELLSLGAVSVISDLAEGVLQGEPRA
jgi:glycerophosphoryl diester phosphodiesterase